MSIHDPQGPALPCGSACAGFPSPADGHLDPPVDLTSLLSPPDSPGSPFPCEAPWACGGAGFLVLRHGADPRAGDVVLALVDGVTRPALIGIDKGRRQLRDHDGRPLASGEARIVGTARWAVRAHAGEGVDVELGGPIPDLVRDKASGYLFRVDGWSMRDAGVHDGDVLVVDRAMRPRAGHVVVASVAGAATVKRLVIHEGVARLAFDNAEYPPYSPPHGARVTVFGVVTWCLRDLSRRSP